MKNLLVPTDFSEHANNALRIAFQIARKSEADVYVLHVINALQFAFLEPEDKRGNNAMEQEYLNHVRDNTINELDKIVQKENFPVAKVKILVEVGNIHKNINESCNKYQIDLVVMGTQGTRPVQEIFIGSNTEKVVRTAPCPVLSVRDKPENFITSKILFASNLKDHNPVVFRRLKEIQSLFDAHIYLLYVNSYFGMLSEEEIEVKKNHFVAEAGLENYSFLTVTAQSEEAGIMVTARKMDVDIISLITHQRKGLANFFLGSTAEDIVNHSQRPVLSLGLHMED